MKKILILLFVFSFILNFSNVKKANAQFFDRTMMNDSIISEFTSEVNSDSVQSHIQFLQDMGTRFMIAPNRKEVAESIKGGDLKYWRDVWDSYEGPVTRVEWEVKPKKSGFQDLVDFYELDEMKIVMLLNYLIEWGRLCIPNQGDTNNRRWKLSPFWLRVREAARDWSDGVHWPIARVGYKYKGVSEEYARQVAGILAGAMARFNNEKPNLYDVLTGLEDYDLGLDKIQKKAELKAEIIKRL